MARLWIKENQGNQEAGDEGCSGPPRWVAWELTGESTPLQAVGEPAAGVRDWCGDAGLLMRATGPAGEVWTLFGTSAVRVNGAPMLLGMRVLNDRDEIRVGCGSRSYFSTERLAEIELFPGADRRTFCARCKTEIREGSPAVKCPGCGVWHHESGAEPDGLRCWAYPGTATCALCPNPNDNGAGFRWTPDVL